MKEFRIALFASGNGTNAEKIMHHFAPHSRIEVALLLSNNSEAQVLQRVTKYHVPTKVFTRNQFRESDEVLNWLKAAGITHLVLSGFMWLVPTNLVEQFEGRIINIHPALLPKFGGKGMYGKHVHEAVKAAGEQQTGITIHVVDTKYDEGKIIFQVACVVEEHDTPTMIAQKVQLLEHTHYAKIIEQWILEK